MGLDRRLGRHIRLFAVLVPFLGGTLWGGLVLRRYALELPRPDTALDAPRAPGVALEDSGGKIFATQGDFVGASLRLAQLPPALPQAVVAIEDRRFYSHGGFDLLGMVRAVWVNLKSRRLMQGGSTITQQVAKNLFLSNARTLKRKIQEAMLTIWLEQHFTKQQILEIWLNRVYLGNDSWGVDAGARTYFGTSATKLTLPQAAVLAGVPQAPSRVNPRMNATASAARGRDVLAAMVRAGNITPQAARQASADIAFSAQPPHAGDFAAWALAQSPVNRNDTIVRTTLNDDWQSVLNSNLHALPPNIGAAAVVLDMNTGAVLAAAARGITVDRILPAMAGLRPFVWMAALEAGATPADAVLPDMSIAKAYAAASQPATDLLLRQAGGPAVIGAAMRRLGVDNDGTINGMSVMGFATAMAAMENGGVRHPPWAVAAVTMDGHLRTVAPPAGAQVIDPDIAHEMADMLYTAPALGHWLVLRQDSTVIAAWCSDPADIGVLASGLHVPETRHAPPD